MFVLNEMDYPIVEIITPPKDEIISVSEQVRRLKAGIWPADLESMQELLNHVPRHLLERAQMLDESAASN